MTGIDTRFVSYMFKRNPYSRDRSGGGMINRLRSRLNIKNITFKGYEGRWWRRGAAALGVLLLIIIAAAALRPEAQIMSSVEISRVRERGILYVGVRSDVPGFNENGEGAEIELAQRLAERVLPDAEDPIKFFDCTSKTVSTKLSDGSIDVAIALLPNGKSRAYAYSYAYYTDNVYLVTLKSELVSAEPTELKIGYIQDTPSADVLTAYKNEITAVKEKSLFEKIFGKPDETYVVEEAKRLDLYKFGSYKEAIDALRRGDIDAVVMAGAYVNKYFVTYAAEYTGRAKYYLNNTVIGTIDYCFVSSSDEPAFMRLADMMIYDMQKDGSLYELLREYGL